MDAVQVNIGMGLHAKAATLTASPAQIQLIRTAYLVQWASM